MSVRLGLLLPTREAVMSGRPETAPLVALAEHAEAVGLDSVWVGDSLTARPRHDPLTLLAAVAARTRRVVLGTAVLLPGLRQPLGLAQAVATLDRLAEGRLVLGVGVAADTPATRREFAAAGIPWERRAGRALEVVGVCRALWSREAVSVRGAHFILHEVTVEPRPHQEGGPPVWIGGSGPIALREAARHDGWIPTSATVAAFAQGWRTIRGAARDAGRPEGAVTGAVYLTLALDPDPASAEARLHRYLEGYYGAPARAILARQGAYAGSAEGAVDWLRHWVAAGARHLVLRFAGGDQRAQVDVVARARGAVQAL